MDFPRLQIAFLAGALLLVHVIFLDLTLNVTYLFIYAATTLCLLWQLWWVLPYTVFWRKEVKTSKVMDHNKTFSVMTANGSATSGEFTIHGGKAG